MKAITLTQPWATLVAIGAKKIETRVWRTDYRGPLAIHAAKGWEPSIRADARRNHQIAVAMERAGLTNWDFLPRGCVVCTVRLVAVLPITKREHGHQLPTLQASMPLMAALSDEVPVPEWVSIPPDEPERSFGDYTAGRYAWVLRNLVELPEPVPARGGLGLWEWEPKGVEA